MDSLKSLIDSRQYDLVVKLTENSLNASDLFYRIAALTCLGKYEEALYVIQDNQKSLEKNNLVSLITIHIQLLCVLERYDQAHAVLNYYQDLPYESQIVEETLRKMPELIEHEEKKSQAIFYSEDDIIDKLSSYDNNDVIFGLDLVKKRDVLSFLPYLSKILVSFPNQTIRGLTLMLLVEKEVDRNLKYLSYKGEILVNPKNTKPPFTGETFNKVLKIMDIEFKDTTLSQNGAQILSSLIIYTYPFGVEKNEKEIAWAIYVVSNRLISNEVDIKKLADTHNLDFDIFNNYISLIDDAMEDI